MALFENLMDSILYLSRLQGTPILSEEQTQIGKLQDIFVDYEEMYPTVLAIQYRHKNQYFYIEWDDIKRFSYKNIIIKNEARLRTGRTYPRVKKRAVLTSLLATQFTGDTIDYPPLGKVVLDKQIVDISGKKVVRVNDINLLRVGRKLRVTHAGIGFRSLARRLGYESIIDLITKIIKPYRSHFLREALINWKHVHAIPDKNIQKDVKLNMSNNELEALHPADLADILEDLDPHARRQIFSYLDAETAAEVLPEVEPDMQASFLQSEDPEKAANIIELMGTDEAADLLADLSEKEADEIISKIDDDEIQEEINELLEYEEDTAGGLMTTEVFQINGEMTGNEIIEYFKNNHEDIESVYDIYIVDEDEKLQGTCSIRQLLINNLNIKIKEIMEVDDIKSLSPNTKWKNIASFMSKYDLATVPILDDNNELLGIVCIDDVIPWLLDER